MARHLPVAPTVPVDPSAAAPVDGPALRLIASPAPTPAAEARRLHPAAAHLLEQSVTEAALPRLRIVPPVAS